MLLAETKGWQLCKGAWVATITGNGVWSWRRSAVTCQVFQAFGIPAILRPPPEVCNFIYNRNKNPFQFCAPAWLLAFCNLYALKGVMLATPTQIPSAPLFWAFLHNVNVWQMCHKQGFFFWFGFEKGVLGGGRKLLRAVFGVGLLGSG